MVLRVALTKSRWRKGGSVRGEVDRSVLWEARSQPIEGQHRGGRR